MTREQTALLQKARDSVRGAQALADIELYDFAVSRAYYAMFYAAEALLLGKGLSFSKHSAVIAAFGQHFSKAGLVPAQFHHYLIDAEDQRNRGDYRVETGLTAVDAAEQIAHAQQFVELAEHLIRSQYDENQEI